MSKIFKTIWYYEWVTFSRNKTQVFLLGIVFLFGVYAIFCGKANIDEQRETIAQLTTKENAEFNGYQASFQEELVSTEAKQLRDVASKPNFAWFRHGYHVTSSPTDFANLAIGQRDLYRYYYRLTGMSLYYQLYQNEIANPFYLLVGNLDLSFILIYIFPLLIIVFCYSMYSGEKDAGILPLLRIQSASIRRILLVRLTFFFLLITGLALLLSFVGFLVSGNLLQGSNGHAAMAWCILTVGYCLFWFGLLFFIIAFRQSTSFNAICAIGAWVLILIIIPAVLNTIIEHNYPLNSNELAGLTRRTGLEDETDVEESKEVISEFLKYRPEYAKDSSLYTQNLMSKAYASFTFLKDTESKKIVDSYNKSIQGRSQWESNFSWANPAVTAQQTFSRIAHTDLANYMVFQTEIAGFHKDVQDFYFQRLFADATIKQEDYDNRPYFETSLGETNWYSKYVEIGIVALMGSIFFFKGLLILKRTR